jgi:uncharacterized membrane protein
MIKHRPFPITAVCVYLLASSSFYLVTSFSYLNNPDNQAFMASLPVPYAVQVAMLYLSPIVFILSAIFIWEEANWARWLYLGWGFVDIDYNLYLQPDWHNNVIRDGLYLVFALILLLPSANEYFSTDFEYEEI